ncbi:hypothetical protein PT974_01756 [Cladobotryum mycophilum]|uniref:Phytanoyl-CoA dioxygenase n=1 Tax=Cladobotryum mycophilum TaxID=491253 RepID=A0ABR0SX01_9HYPO
MKIPQLYANDGPLPPDQIGLLVPTDPFTTDFGVVRQRLADDGYVLLKGLLPREDVLRVREKYFGHLSAASFLKPGTAAVDGIFNSDRDISDFPSMGATVVPPGGADQFMKLATELIDYVSKLNNWGSNTRSIARTVIRNATPGNKGIGVHYDYIFLRYGEDTVLTGWVPMGDIKIEGGGLIYLEKGHELGMQFEKEFTEKAIASGFSEEEAKSAYNTNMMQDGILADGAREYGLQQKRRWLASAYEAGDVVLHSSYSIHSSTINHDKEGIIRLGTDLRFVDTSRPWDERWDNVFHPDDGL